MKKKNFLFIAIGSALLLCLQYSLKAQETDSLHTQDTLPRQTLNEIVVTASRQKTYQLKTPEAIRVLDSKSIRKYQARTTPEALQLTPGVFVQKTNHGGGSPFLRGLTGNQTLLIIDGIRLSNATVRYGPNQYFNTIDVFSLEKIEILRGSGSVQYGSDAIGGTIQAFSHELKNEEISSIGGTLLTRIATRNMEQSLHGAVNYTGKTVSLRAGGSWRNFGDIVGGDTTGVQIPTGYDELDFDLKGRIALSSSSYLTLAYQQVHQGDVPIYHKVALENYAVNRIDPQLRRLAYIRLYNDHNYGILKSSSVTAAYHNTTEIRELQKKGSDIFRTETDKVHSLSFSAEALTSDKKIWSANSGFEMYHDLVKSSRSDEDITTGVAQSGRGLYPDGSTMTSLALFSIHTFNMGKWELNAGSRFNAFIIKVTDENTGPVTLSPSALVGNLALIRKLNGSSSLFVSANTGFRAPNIDDLGTLGIVDFRYEIPNTDLKPEHSFQYQAGYKYQGKMLRGEFYIYRNELDDLIVRSQVPGDTIEGYPVYTKENIERTYIQGIETAWDLELTRSWTLSGSLTYTYGQNMTKDEPVRRIPPLFGRLALEYNLKGWWINTELVAAGKQDRLAAGDISDNRIPEGGTPGWNIININTGYTFRFITIDLSLQNILNADYRTHGSGVNGCGRSAFLTIVFNI
jgi:hemoglobin/transferrin/lactoferrin receptor protein